MKRLLRTTLALGMMASMAGAYAKNSHNGMHPESDKGTANALTRVDGNKNDHNSQGIERAKARLALQAAIQQACQGGRVSRECLLAKDRMKNMQDNMQDKMKDKGYKKDDNKGHQMMMKHHDVNNDGVVSRSEFENTTTDHFDRMDMDRNGVIDQAEIQNSQAHKRAAHRMAKAHSKKN